MNELRHIGEVSVDRPAVERTPLVELERRASRRVGRRRAAVAGAAVVVLIIGIGALARAGAPDASVETRAGTTVPAHQTGDLVIFMKVAASPPEVDAVRDQLLSDPAITGVRYSSQTDSLEDFRCLFADQHELQATVTADILPSSFRIDIAGGQAGVDEVRRRYADVAGVMSIVSPADIATGSADTSGGIDVDDPSLALASDCPLVGTVLK